jgi:hypothetical protein
VYIAVSSPERMAKSWHIYSSQQTLWKCVAVQIFGNDSNKSKLDPGGLIRLMTATVGSRTCSIFVCCLKTLKLECANYEYNFACGFVWMWNLGPLTLRLRGRGFDTRWGEFLNFPNSSGRTLPRDLLSHSQKWVPNSSGRTWPRDLLSLSQKWVPETLK